MLDLGFCDTESFISLQIDSVSFSRSEEHWKVLFRNKYRFLVPVADSWVRSDPLLQRLCWD